MDGVRLLSVDETAERLGLNRHQVYRRIERGDIKAKTVNDPYHRYVVPESELDGYDGKLTPPTPTPDRGRLLRPSEVARLTGHTVEQIRAYCRMGLLESQRAEGSRSMYRIPRDAAEKFFGPLPE